MPEYVVKISNVFEAENYVDAVDQMVSYVVDNGTAAGYRVKSWPDEDKLSEFVDAEDIYRIADALREKDIDLWDATDEQVRDAISGN